jgi:hypothetical protein
MATQTTKTMSELIRETVFLVYIETGEPVSIEQIAQRLGLSPASTVLRRTLDRGPVPGTEDALPSLSYFPSRAYLRSRYRGLAADIVKIISETVTGTLNEVAR